MNEATPTTSVVIQAASPQQQAPQSPDILQISTVDAVLGVAVTLVGIGIAWGTLKSGLNTVTKTLLDTVVPDLKDVRERFVVVEDRVETLWRDKFAPAHSPRNLNERGQSVLDKSGIKEVVDEKLEKLFELVQSKTPKTAYDAEREIFSVMFELREHCPDIIDRLKDGAFKAGADIDALLFVGGIYLRNQIFPRLGFSLEDLDAPTNTQD